MTATNTYTLTRATLRQYVLDAGTDPVTAMLVSGYIHDDEHEDAADATAYEVTTGGAARITLTVSGTATDGTWLLQSDDPSFPGLTATAVDGVVVFADEGADSASPLICHLSFPPTDITADTLTIELDDGVLVEVSENETDLAALTAAVAAEIDAPVASSGTDGQVWTNVNGASAEWADANGGSPAIVWDPNAEAVYADADRYDVWAEFTAAVAAAPFGPKDLIFGADTTIPAGAFDLNGGRLVGGQPGGLTRVTFADGATLTNFLPDIAYYAIQLYSISTTPIITISHRHELIFDAGVQVFCQSAEFIRYTATSGAVVISLRNSELIKPSDLGIGGGDYEVVNQAGTPDAFVIAGVTGYGHVTADTLRGTGPAIFIKRTAGCDFSATQTNLTSGVFPMLFTFAEAVGVDSTSITSSAADELQTTLEDLDAALDAYTPATDAHWVDPNPTSLRAAVDRLAAQLYTTTSNTPIP